MSKINQIDITVSGDLTAAREAAVAELQTRKFRLTWDGDWNATAERGNKILNVVAGAMAHYFKVGLKLSTTPEGKTLVQVLRESRGTMGGAIGVVRTNKDMERLKDDLTKS